MRTRLPFGVNGFRENARRKRGNPPVRDGTGSGLAAARRRRTSRDATHAVAKLQADDARTGGIGCEATTMPRHDQAPRHGDDFGAPRRFQRQPPALRGLRPGPRRRRLSSAISTGALDTMIPMKKLLVAALLIVGCDKSKPPADERLTEESRPHTQSHRRDDSTAPLGRRVLQEDSLVWVVSQYDGPPEKVTVAAARALIKIGYRTKDGSELPPLPPPPPSCPGPTDIDAIKTRAACADDCKGHGTPVEVCIDRCYPRADTDVACDRCRQEVLAGVYLENELERCFSIRFSASGFGRVLQLDESQ